MAQIPGTNISDKIVPNDTNDTFATHDEMYGMGGWRSVENITERDLITIDRRKEGMIVNVLDIDKQFQLKGGINNSNWSTIVIQTSGNYTSTLGGLSDVILSDLHPGQVLSTDGTNWFNTNPISGDNLQGTLELDSITLAYTIVHSPIVSLSTNYPIVSLQVPISGDSLLILGITNRTLTSFDVILSQIPNTTGYYVNWSMGGNIYVQNITSQNLTNYTPLTTTSAISGNLQSQIIDKQDNITLNSGSNVTIIESPTDTWTISASISGGGIEYVSAPSSPTDSGTRGQRAYGGNYVYECIATNTWVKYAAASSW